MATNKELKALITLAGKIDPSLQQSLLKAQKESKKTGDAMNLMGKMGKGAMGMMKSGAKAALVGLTGLAVAGGAALWQMGKAGLSAASDLAEVQNVVDVTFGESAGKVDAWSQSLLKSYGLGELSAKKYSSTLGAMLKSTGIEGDDMLTMSENLTMLTGDMASFYNLKPDEMFEKLRSGISGETEPLKQLGINMSAANLEAFALSQGIKESYSSMGEAEKTALRYNYIMDAAKDSQGDFARTSDSMSNQQKLLKENFTQLSAEIMQSATPALASIMQGLNGFMTSMDTAALGSFVGEIGKLAMELLPIAMKLLPVIQGALTTLLPPLMEIIKIILPPITKFLEFVVKIAGASLSKLAEIIGKIAGFFGKEQSGKRKENQRASAGKGSAYNNGNSGAVSSGAASGYNKFARGGFANHPSIFGEAGLEAAIPIKPGNPRSLSLLQKTSQLLGMSESISPAGGSSGSSWQLTYAPVVNGVPAEQLEPILHQNLLELEQLLNRKANLQRRMSFGLA